MKSAMEKALDKIGNLDIQKMEEPKKEKGKDNECCPSMDYYKPTIYLDDKELSTIGNYKIGDKVILVIECSVKSLSQHEEVKGKEKKKVLHCDLCVEAIADITKG
jgi:hypothetical protein